MPCLHQAGEEKALVLKLLASQRLRTLPRSMSSLVLSRGALAETRACF